jgi:protein-disulfide isomerase
MGVMLLLSALALSSASHAQQVADAGPVPVGAQDASRGPAEAPVTMVVFTDLECPYCDKLHTTVDDLAQTYGDKLRIVYKHMPLPMHRQARDAALAAEAVRKLKGQRGFWRFVDTAFDKLRGGSVDEVLAAAGFDKAAVKKEIASGRPAKKVDADIALAQKVGVRGTPASFINGVFVSGARGKSDLASIIDSQLAEAKAAKGRGVSAKQMYAELSKKNFTTKQQPSSSTATPPVDTTTVW